MSHYTCLLISHCQATHISFLTHIHRLGQFSHCHFSHLADSRISGSTAAAEACLHFRPSQRLTAFSWGRISVWHTVLSHKRLHIGFTNTTASNTGRDHCTQAILHWISLDSHYCRKYQPQPSHILPCHYITFIIICHISLHLFSFHTFLRHTDFLRYFLHFIFSHYYLAATADYQLSLLHYWSLQRINRLRLSHYTLPHYIAFSFFSQPFSSFSPPLSFSLFWVAIFI